MEETQQKRVAAVIFSADLARCVSNQHRLAPTYIGIRRVRPSSKLVKQALHGKEFGKIKPTTLPNVVFKLVDEETGEERRMTSKEKKKVKSKRRNQQREAFQQQKASEQARPQASDNPIASHEKNEAEKNLERLTNSEDGDCGKVWESEENNNDRYAHLSIDHSALEQELADLRGERDGVPPVALSAPLTFTGIQLGLLGDVRHTPALKIVLDEDLARKWGETLKESMLPAEAQRRAENLREMPYHLVPEVWMRMKPQMLGQPLQINTMPTVSVPVGPRDVAFYEIRPSLRDTYSRDTASDAVVQLLHSNTSLNLSCGAKFGSDFLLYDGNRSARHAFAGMRVVEGDEEFPLPKAYDLSGYVRCLNTAGKLALLAWVQRRGDVHHVAIIDLALEKLVDRGAKRSRQTALERRYNTLAKK